MCVYIYIYMYTFPSPRSPAERRSLPGSRPHAPNDVYIYIYIYNV